MLFATDEYYQEHRNLHYPYDDHMYEVSYSIIYPNAI